MQPFPLVPIETRRHIVGDPVRTRYGVGDVRIDHAAGVPLAMRRSHSAPQAMPPSMDWDDRPSAEELRRQRPYAYYDEEDAPVVLPMQPRRTALIVAATLVIMFIAVCASIVFSGVSATTLISHSASRTDAVQPHR